jgi:hypothetical protein
VLCLLGQQLLVGGALTGVIVEITTPWRRGELLGAPGTCAGASLGGMIVQTVTITDRERVRSLTSIMPMPWVGIG